MNKQEQLIHYFEKYYKIHKNNGKRGHYYDVSEILHMLFEYDHISFPDLKLIYEWMDYRKQIPHLTTLYKDLNLLKTTLLNFVDRSYFPYGDRFDD